MPKTINDLVMQVKNGEFPDVPRPQGERILTMAPALISNYSIILANCLLNTIPEENSENIFKVRAALFDQIIETVNLSNFGRINRVVGLIDHYCKESMEQNPECWPKRREANNIFQWAADYFTWDDRIRQEFFGITEETAQTEPAQEVDEGAKEVPDENIPKPKAPTPAPIGTKRQEVKEKKPVPKPPKRVK